jgi:hypothetical protein
VINGPLMAPDWGSRFVDRFGALRSLRRWRSPGDTLAVDHARPVVVELHYVTRNLAPVYTSPSSTSSVAGSEP